MSTDTPHIAPDPPAPEQTAVATIPAPTGPAPTSPLVSYRADLSTARLAHRRRADLAMTALLAAVVALAVAVLVWVLSYVAAQGFKYLGPEFLTQTPPGDPGQGGGGFANGIIGSLIVVGLATAIAVPVGIAAAIYLNEYGGPIAQVARFLTDVLVGIPTIVTGAFVYALWVTRFGFSGLAGAIALAMIMLPLIIRTTEEMLRLVPNELREASLALGVSRARTILSIVLPTATGGIITGCMLAIARAMGETAPLLLTALGNDLFIETHPTHRMSTLSLQVFGNAITGFQAAQGRAWAGALTMVILVLLFTAIARVAGRRATASGGSS
ncbi:phosphate ABC transporter permease PstA [Frankia sp. AgB1.9]|uniref:phosphate ABC transporter permease PstA n=1 Tax=unclassified Frankia TaxID=2632575 RepID=UPI001931E333|nr:MULTISPECIES: phosphate ABC transporter permease PstA [unclassified Frankia]MBL7491600.1 phosphate ABC transporter permease PstA [Frankia sp. AgW1.1]MBL7554048.1 phosphate ABC transporter permease PstA [Frankia sp. AgB1.9]MBL7618230.1 phosphate ABC transporter permease PstA [Frankia sp. AgB1.8]